MQKHLSTILLYASSAVLLWATFACVAPETGADTTGARIGAGIDRGVDHAQNTPVPTNPIEAILWTIGTASAIAGGAVEAKRRRKKKKREEEAVVNWAVEKVNQERDAARLKRGEQVS